MPWIVVGFSPQDSNLPLRAGCILGRAQMADDPAPPLPSLGRVDVPMAHLGRNGDGVAIPAVEPADGIVFEAKRPDVYTVRGDGAPIQVIANLLDPRQADINHSRLGDRETMAGTASRRFPMEPWALLLLIGALLLLAEWAAYTRRLTS